MAESSLTIFHGSSEQRPKPTYGLGKPANDYGRGFYCTENLELAKEWACADGNNGYAQKYKQRDYTARQDYKTLKKNAMAEDGTYIMDIIRAKWNNDDTRLR